LRFAGFDYFNHNVLLHVRLNDALDGRMILDTGGASTEITPRVARDLNLKVVTVAGDPPYKQTTVSRLIFGGVELKDVVCDVAPGLPLKQWDAAHPDSKLLGILGIDRLKEWAIGIVMDFPASTLYISPHQGYIIQSVHNILRLGIFPQFQLTQRAPKSLTAKSSCKVIVFPGSPAALAGIEEGDDLLTINGVAFTSFDGSNADYLLKPIVLVVTRKGVKMRLTITVPALQ
jgi:hypothetical protein